MGFYYINQRNVSDFIKLYFNCIVLDYVDMFKVGSDHTKTYI